MLKVRRTGFLFIFVMVLCTGMQAGEGARVVQVRPFLAGDSLHVLIRSEQVFDEKITGTIKSGLPCLVEVEIELRDAAGRVLERAREPFRISYDIWEEKYQLQSRDSTRIFVDFARIRRYFTVFRSAAIVPLRALATAQRYRLRVRIGVAPISSRQSRKLSGWLEAGGQKSEEDITSEERSSGFRVNVSVLVSWFLGNTKKRTHYSPWFVRVFEPAQLAQPTPDSK